MPLNLMSSDREDLLIKAAEATIGLMNVGVAPNAALLKVAVDNQLNENEVQLVSHAVNNSKAISHLVNAEKPEDKEKPYLLTNAEVVNQNLYNSDPVLPGAEKDLKAESKKEAAAKSCIDDGYYLDVAEDFVDPVAIFGKAAALPQAKIASLEADDNLTFTVSDGIGARTKLAALKRAAAEAREAATAAVDSAQVATTKFANEMRRPGAINFAEVEKVAVVLGASPDTARDIFEATGLGRFGHARALSTKIAGIIETTKACKDLADTILHVENLMKRAAQLTDVQEHLLAEYERLDTGISKLAEGDTNAVDHVASEVGDLPDKLTGAAFHNTKAIDLLNAATGSGGATEHPVEFNADKPALGSEQRQELANFSGRTAIEKLMGDEYIGKHPPQNVVAAYNRAIGTDPNLGEAALQSLIRRDLAGGGHVDLDTVLRIAKNPGLKAH